MPPVMAFHLGSLGFLTPFSFENFQAQVTQVIQGESRRWAEPTVPCGSGFPWVRGLLHLGQSRRPASGRFEWVLGGSRCAPSVPWLTFQQTWG